MGSMNLEAFDSVTLSVFAALAALSALATAVSLFKTLQFMWLGVGKHRKAERIISDWLEGQADAAVDAAGKRDGVLPRVLFATLSGLRARPGEAAYAQELGRQTALLELARMNRQMRILEAVVQAAPMLGLLGTVIGMIDAFGRLSEASGAADPSLLAQGIWTALTTTAVGLTVAIIFYFIATWLESRIDSERQSMETLISAAVHGRVAPAKRGG